VDGALLQTKVWYGYKQAAAHIGQSFNQHRATDGLTPPLAGTALQALVASFNVQDMAYKKSSQYGKALWWCVADGSQLLQGDYLSGNGYTYFIGNMEPLLPITAVLCNRSVSLYRPAQQQGVGQASYGGNTQATQTQYLNQFPGSILATGRTAKNVTDLPGDASSANAVLCLPPVPGVQIVPYDVVMDDLKRRYLVTFAELAEHGWRCGIVESEA
jgi:hypothetical protein